jgi:glycosyltransferase involved in cell wall biosynthesis
MGQDVDGDTPLVSVIVPTYGRPAFLTEALESVAGQTYPRTELIVVDDHSPDPVSTLLEDLDLGSLEAVSCIRHDRNRGANAARNTGIDSASGDLLAFLDDDDYWLPEKLRLQVERLRSTPADVGVVFTGQRYVDGDGETTHVREPVSDTPFLEGLVSGAPFGPFSAVLVDATLVEQCGALDDRLPSWQDREWYFRLAQHAECAVVSDPVAVRRYADQDQLTDEYERKRDVAYPLFVSKHRSTAAQLGSDGIREFESTLARTLALAALQYGEYEDSVRYLWKSLRYAPFTLDTYLYLLVALGGEYTYRPARRLKRWHNTRPHQ